MEGNDHLTPGRVARVDLHPPGKQDVERIGDLALVDDDRVLRIRADDAARRDLAQGLGSERPERIGGRGSLGHGTQFGTNEIVARAAVLRSPAPFLDGHKRRGSRTSIRAAARGRQSYLRISSMTLPSLASWPGAWNETTPRSFVTSRIDATIASAIVDRLSGISTCSVMRSTPSALSTTSRARMISGCRRRISATCEGCTNMPLTFVV